MFPLGQAISVYVLSYGSVRTQQLHSDATWESVMSDCFPCIKISTLDQSLRVYESKTRERKEGSGQLRT